MRDKEGGETAEQGRKVQVGDINNRITQSSKVVYFNHLYYGFSKTRQPDT